MTPRIGTSGTPPVGPAEPVSGIAPIAQPRQLAGQPSFASLLNKPVLGQVLARLDDGHFLVRMNEFAARMPLPTGTALGAQLPLTLVELNPRPVFQLRMAQADATLQQTEKFQGDLAPLQQLPTTWIGGSPAASRAASLAYAGLAAAQPVPLPHSSPDGADGTQTSLSPAGSLLGKVLAAVAEGGRPAQAVAGQTPLLNAPPVDGAGAATALQQGMETSGLFYESHVAEWAQGRRSLDALAAEPQARGMPPPPDPATSQLINLQLQTQEQASVAWQGQLWPGQDLRWEIRRDAGGGGDRTAGDAEDGSEHAAWHSGLTLRFGRLGEVAAKVVLSGGQLHIRLDVQESARTRLEAGRERLADALEAAGTPLHTLAIHGQG